MLEGLLKYDKIGSKDELAILLFHILSPNSYKKIQDVKTICINHSYNFGSSFDGILYLLALLDLVNIEEDQIKADPIIAKFLPNQFFKDIFIYQRLFGLLKVSDKLKDLFNYNNTKFDHQTLRYYIKESQIPSSLNCIKKFLINSEFLTKEENIPNTYFINSVFNDFFSSYVVINIKKKILKTKISLSRLKEIQSLQNEYGEQAEEFVLQFERKRLAKHPSIKTIKRISDDFANAGFDIESFNTEDSIFNDRLIEVKSYNGNISFYWSANEIETSKENSDCYFLYLVDRSRVSEINYSPHIIQDPYKNLFLNDTWEKNPESYFVSFLH